VAELESGRDVLSLEPLGDVVAAPAFHPDGERFAWAAGRDVHQGRLPAGSALLGAPLSWNPGSQVGGLTWVGDELLAWLARGRVETFGRSDTPPPLSEGGFTYARVDARGERVVFATLTGAVRVAGIDGGWSITLRESGPRGMVGWSEDGLAVWAADAEGVELWTAEGRPVLRLPAVEPGAVLSPVVDATGTLRMIGSSGLLAISPAPEAYRGLRLAGGVPTCADAPGRLVCVSKQKGLLSLAPGHPPTEVALPAPEPGLISLWSLCLTEQGAAATTGASLFDLGGDRAVLLHQAREPLAQLACGPDGTVATASEATLLLWRRGEPLRAVPLPGPAEEILAWNGRWLARCGDAWSVWAADGVPLGALEGGDGCALAAAPDGRLALLAREGGVTIRAPGSSAVIAQLQVQPGAQEIAWIAPTRVATYDGRTIEVHELDSPQPLAILGELPVSLSWWGPIAGEPWLLTATHEGELTWWDLSLLDLPAHGLAARIRAETGFVVEGGRLALAPR
jgi:hypothetical protein